MWDELETLDKAIACIEEEQSSVQIECDAFRKFRETVSLARPARSGNSGNPTRMTELAESYQETVMSTPDYRSTYGDSLVESLRAELTPSIADALCSETELTQKQKRNLLLATTRAIEEREIYCEILETERNSIQSIQSEISDINKALRQLPPCSRTQLSFDEYATVWAEYDSQLDRCDRLLQDRQVSVREARQPNLPRNEDSHALNEYLFNKLETTYPALRAIAGTRQHIVDNRDDADSLTKTDGRNNNDSMIIGSTK